MTTTLFLVKFPDGGIYATGPQTRPDGREVPGGVIAFTEHNMALEAASAIAGGTVVFRDLDALIAKAQSTRIPLYIRHARGTYVIEETIPPQPADTSLIRVTGDERERLLQVETQQCRRWY